MRRDVVRSVELNMLSLTRAKQEKLFTLFSEYARAANEALSMLKSQMPASDARLHHLTYKRIRSNSRLPAQLVCAARLDAWAKRRHTITAFRHLPISYNVPRSGSLKETKRGNPILSVATLTKRNTSHLFQ